MIEVLFVVEDNSGDKSTTTLKLPDGFSLAQYREWVGLFAGIVNDVISGRIRSASVCLDVDISTLTNNTVNLLSDVEQVGAFEFVTNAGNRVKVNVPSIDETKVVAGTDALDQTDTDILAFITAMEDGLNDGNGVIPFTDRGGIVATGESLIAGTLFAREHFRNSGKRR